MNSKEEFLMKMKKILAIALAMVMSLGMLTACGSSEPAPATKEDTTPLVVGYAPFNSKFSPFTSWTSRMSKHWNTHTKSLTIFRTHMAPTA